MTPPGGSQLLIIFFIVLLLFGSKKLPDLAGAVGKSIKEFRKSTAELEQVDDEEPQRSATESDREA